MINEATAIVHESVSLVGWSIRPTRSRWVEVNLGATERLFADKNSHPRSGEPGAIDWDMIHIACQREFDTITVSPSGGPGIVVGPGRTSGRSFPLFTYRTFEAAGSEQDRVVVGIGFEPSGDSVRINGDISEEESGVVHYDDGCVAVVPLESAAVLSAARSIARRLARQDRLITESARALATGPA